MTLLCIIDEAASDLGIPKASLRTAAEEHGYLVRMGRGSTSSSTARTGTSVTRGSPTAQRATQAAKMLKKHSGPTSPPKGAHARN